MKLNLSGALGLQFTRFTIDWLDQATQLLPLLPVGKPLSIAANGDGGLISEQGANEHFYLTSERANLNRSPEYSPELPNSDIDIQVFVDTDIQIVSFWAISFTYGRVTDRKSWPLHGKVLNVQWTPPSGVDQVRFAFRFVGSGEVRSLALRGQSLSVSDADEINRVWKELHAPKHLNSRRRTARINTLKNAPRHDPPQRIEPPAWSMDPDISRDQLHALGITPEWLVLDRVTEGAEVFEHLKTALRDGVYTWRCPFSGEDIRSNDTFLVSEPEGRPYTFVRYEYAGRIYYCVYCPFRGSRIGLYLPDVHVVVSRLRLQTLIVVFRRFMLRHESAVRRYLRYTGPRPTLVPLNTMSHFGHVMLNELEALTWLFESGAASAVDRWMIGEIGFWPIERLFPQIAAAEPHFQASIEGQFLYCLEERAFIVRPEIAFMGLAARTQKRLLTYCRHEGERIGTLEEIRDQLTGHFPILWIEARSTDRLWLNQAEGLSATAQRLKPLYPNMAIVVAGWSRMTSIREEDARMIDKDLETINGIRTAFPDIPCFTVLGESTASKILWALNCHCHITIFGSGIIYPILAGLPGLVLCSRYYQENEVFLTDPRKRVRMMDGDEHLSFVPSAFIEDDIGEANAEIRGFRIEPSAIADQIEIICCDLKALSPRTES